MRVSPQEMQRIVKDMEANATKAKRLSLVVGLPKGEATSKIYEGGETVVDVAYTHEYGAGPIPQRSFLRVPFKVKRNEIDKALANAFQRVFEKGHDPENELELVGVRLQNISKKAFENNGYGTWKPLSPATIAEKGSSKPLIDTGTLRGSITYEVRDAT